jgi:hypothetical protein
MLQTITNVSLPGASGRVWAQPAGAVRAIRKQAGIRNALRPQLFDQRSRGSGGPLGAAVVHVGGAQVIQAQQIKDGRVNIVNVMRFF